MGRTNAGNNTSSQAHFATVDSGRVERSVFNRDSGHKTTFDAGKLIPFFVDEILPGDTMRLSTAALVRLATPIFPLMDNIYLDFHYFFVPNRLVWSNWEKFLGAQEDPDSSIDYLVPQIQAGFSAAAGTLSNYFGICAAPVAIPQADCPNALIYRAYNLIWNTWYRDENLQDSVDVPLDDGPDPGSFYTVLRRNRRKDYFTSMLPWPQKGDPVTLPFSGVAPVLGIGTNNQVFGGPNTAYESDGTTSSYTLSKTIGDSDGANLITYIEGQTIGGQNYPNVRVSFTDTVQLTINAIRESATLQQLFERDARGGTRYTELLLSHFGVTAPDFRLQRPELLGVGTMMLNATPVPQTGSTDATTPQGNLAAYGVSRASGIGFNKSFVEHGHVIGIVSARADNTYQQGLNKMWSRRTKYDFAWPTFAHLGEQAVARKELILDSTSTTTNNSVIGYQERYAEYRYKPSIVTGEFMSAAPGSLDSWHLAMDLATGITLETLIVEDPPIDRVIAIPSSPHFLFDSFTTVRHARPLPTYSIPGIDIL